MQPRSWTSFLTTIAKLTLLGIACSLLAVPGLRAQIDTATIEGYITDPSGGVVPSASVVAINEQTHQTISAKSDTTGNFQILEVPVGTYSVNASATGFKKSDASNVIVHAGTHNRVDFHLQLGSTTETVTVTGGATQVDTQTAEVSETVTERQIEDLPLNGRDPGTLVELIPGNNGYSNVSWWGFPTTFVTSSGTYFQNRGTDWLLDGGLFTWTYVNSGDTLPNPDALQEFDAVSSQRSAEYGRENSATINATFKSGTNQLHGDAWEFYRGAGFNSRSYGQNYVTPKLNENQFGFTVGGPIIRDKLFFFGSYEGLREVGASYIYETVVPTALERQGDFSQSAVIPINPATNLPYTNDVVPIDPVSQKFLSYIPTANSPNNSWSGNAPNSSPDNEYIVKGDYNITDKQRLSGSLFLFKNDYLNAQGSSLNIPALTNYYTSGREYQINISHTWSISPNKLNVLRWVSLSTGANRGWLDSGAYNLEALGSNFTQGFDPHPPAVCVSGYFSVDCTNDGFIHSTNRQYTDTFRWTVGRNQLSMGGQIVYYHDHEFASPGPWVYFNGSVTGNAIADYMTGISNSFQYGYPDLTTNLKKHWLFAGFIQDDLKVSRKLTVNLGLRWEDLTGIENPNEWDGTTLAPYKQSIVFPDYLPGELFNDPYTHKVDPGWTAKGYNAPQQEFDPRFGFAYDPFGNGKTALRGGFGIYGGELESIGYGNGSPFGVPSPSCFTGAQPDVPWSNPYVNTCDPILASQGWTGPPANYSASIPAGLGGLDHYRRPYTMNFSFGIQHQVTPGTMIEVSYVAGLTRHNWFNYDLFGGDRYEPGATESLQSRADRYPYLTGEVYGVFVNGTPFSTSYNSLQIKFNRRFGHGLQYTNSVTWSKAMDNNHWPVQDFAYMHSQYGISDSDYAGAWVASFVYAPQIHLTNKFTNQIASGWELTGIWKLQSGPPFTVFTGTDDLVNSYFGSRPDVVADPHLSPHRSRSAVINEWFNTSALVDPGLGQHGGMAVDALRQPGLHNLDASLMRNFKFTERFTFQVHFDTFNSLNFVNLSGVDSTMTDPNFGKITGGAGAMRQLQLGGKLYF
jgi:hypothetical protein